MSYKRYSRHNCSRNHRSWNVAAKCIWPYAEWVDGEGPFAVLAKCRHGGRSSRVLTVTLWSSEEEAEQAKKQIDDTGCGGMCDRNHEIIELQPSARVAP